MARKIITAKQQSRSKTESKAVSEGAAMAAKKAMPCLLTLGDIGEQMGSVSINGWSMSVCLAEVANAARRHVEAMPIPSDRKLAARIKTLVYESCVAISAIEGAAIMLGSEDYDNGVGEHKEAVALGIGIHSLAEKSCKAVDLAAGLLDLGYGPAVCDFDEIRDERAKFGLPVAA